MGHKIYVNGKDFCRANMEMKLPSLKTDLAWALRKGFLEAMADKDIAIIEVYSDGKNFGKIDIDCTNAMRWDFKDCRKFYAKLFDAYNDSRWKKKKITIKCGDIVISIDASSVQTGIVPSVEADELDMLEYAKDEL